MLDLEYFVDVVSICVGTVIWVPSLLEMLFICVWLSKRLITGNLLRSISTCPWLSSSLSLVGVWVTFKVLLFDRLAIFKQSVIKRGDKVLAGRLAWFFSIARHTLSELPKLVVSGIFVKSSSKLKDSSAFLTCVVIELATMVAGLR